MHFAPKNKKMRRESIQLKFEENIVHNLTLVDQLLRIQKRISCQLFRHIFPTFYSKIKLGNRTIQLSLKSDLISSNDELIINM